MIYHFFRKIDKNLEHCFNVQSSKELSQEELEKLKLLLADGFIAESIKQESGLSSDHEVIELGPRLNFATAFSTNAVSICKACGLDSVSRVERSRRYVLPAGVDKAKFIEENHDRMTECLYEKSLESFETGIEPKKVKTVPLIEEGIDALKKINKEMGLGMDDWDEKFYYKMFTEEIKRNPTDMECFQLGQANSEHSRHWFFKGKIVIDDNEMPETLFDVVCSTLDANPANSLIAFKDNSSAIYGSDIQTIIPAKPGKTSFLRPSKEKYHLIFTAETHNFPSGVAPFPGAETGTGGRIRDVQATGKGSLVLAGTVAYCVGNLNIPDYDLPWEDKSYVYPDNLASPLKIEIQASNGASDYGNKFGEPVIQGYTRSFGLKLPNGERREWLKPIMFTGGVGQISDKHVKKDKIEKGMLVIQIGGPAYRIGVGGGSASSMIQGENVSELDFNAVQRGDAEMEQKMNRVIRACVELGDNNPIISVHDQGAGGPCNVLTELVEPIGGRIEVRNIKVGDSTMSVLEIWGAEFQERNAMLIRPEKLEMFKNICQRERVNYENLGEVTGDGKIVVHDSQDDSTPVNLELAKILGKMPQKTFKDERAKQKLEAVKLDKDITISQALYRVLRLLSVGSKRFLVHKVDRSVTGLIAQQQCVGPLQLTVADVAVVAQNHFGLTGAAISIGEQPIKMMVNPKAGARMAVGETLTNMVWARIGALTDIKCSANWMWAAKLPGEGSKLYDAAVAMRDAMIDIGIAIDGGKDSLSMAAKVENEIVKSPGELTISAYASTPDITKVITPDIKKPGQSQLWLINLGEGKCRLGGSALAQVYEQVGKEVPDINDTVKLKNAFLAIQEMIDKNLILSGHDQSDGGLITTVLEMLFAGDCGAEITSQSDFDPISYYFNEELGLVVEIDKDKQSKFLKIIKKYKLSEIVFQIGETTLDKKITIKHNQDKVLSEDVVKLRQLWEETSYQLDKLQTDPACADEEKENIFERQGPKYNVSFTPHSTPSSMLSKKDKPRVAVIREEGSNGDREMTSAFYLAGFEPWDVTMTDLINGKITLDDFKGLVFVGGFSYADVLGSAKGWAGTIRFNEKLKKTFDDFYNRKDTFSLGVCNGCQIMGLLGWVPWKGIADNAQPRFTNNKSGRFESRWSTVKIKASPSIMLSGMEDSVLGIWVAHGEGRLHFPDEKIYQEVVDKKLGAIVYTDDNGEATEKYPFNPNGSRDGITGLTSPDGRHLAMMPHPERVFLKWQWPWMPEELNNQLEASPWLKMFQNAREWVKKNS